MRQLEATMRAAATPEQRERRSRCAASALDEPNHHRDTRLPRRRTSRHVHSAGSWPRRRHFVRVAFAAREPQRSVARVCRSTTVGLAAVVGGAWRLGGGVESRLATRTPRPSPRRRRGRAPPPRAADEGRRSARERTERRSGALMDQNTTTTTTRSREVGKYDDGGALARSGKLRRRRRAREKWGNMTTAARSPRSEDNSSTRASAREKTAEEERAVSLAGTTCGTSSPTAAYPMSAVDMASTDSERASIPPRLTDGGARSGAVRSTTCRSAGGPECVCVMVRRRSRSSLSISRRAVSRLLVRGSGCQGEVRPRRSVWHSGILLQHDTSSSGTTHPPPPVRHILLRYDTSSSGTAYPPPVRHILLRHDISASGTTHPPLPARHILLRHDGML